ncbi:related to conserved hypothetical Ustilaginaceae-specific protein [Ustilago trichophora]|uniref:Related to conserved hypothetical Ustilaginaceae-specific protein n=1 Tax=Ustilago trichophora TaxID=86804 RepID=A0A5C3DW02_9BASI|nr:related to conserved hypothetical Ustilaginaceae-specific protein [Ustilago trichophora]
MKTIFATLLATLALATTGVLSVPVSEHEAHQAAGPGYGPGYGVQPGYGPNPAPNPVGLFGLKRNNQAYHALCDQHSASAKHDHRARACFDTQLVLEKYLSAPGPQRLHGYIDGSGTNMVLYAGQYITLAEKLQIHVSRAHREHDRKRGCANVEIRSLPSFKVQVHEVWCPGRNEPIQL